MPFLSYPSVALRELEADKTTVIQHRSREGPRRGGLSSMP